MLLVVASCSASSDVTRSVGARCDNKDECDERCLPDGEQFPGGFCSLSCLRDADCPGDTACVDEMGGVCLFACEMPTDCEFLGPGWDCVEVDGLPDGKATVCIGQ